MVEFKDRVADTSATTGTGTWTLSGAAPTGRRSFASAHTSGATVHYAASSADGAQWEVGEGVYSAGTLSRLTVFASSNAGALVNFTSPVAIVSTFAAADAVQSQGGVAIASVYRSAALTTIAGVETKLAFDTVEADGEALWDNTNKRFVPTRPGHYKLVAHLEAPSGYQFGKAYLAVYKNGSLVRIFTPYGTSGQFAAHGEVTIYCNGTTDYIEVYYFTSNASATSPSAATIWAQLYGPIDKAKTCAVNLRPVASDKLSVYQGGAGNTPSAATAKAALDTSDVDTNSIWDATNKRATPKKAGWYRVTARYAAASVGNLVLTLYKNGAAHKVMSTDAGANLYAAAGECLVYCNGTTDYVELWVYSNSARAVVIDSSQTWMQMVGPE